MVRVAAVAGILGMGLAPVALAQDAPMDRPATTATDDGDTDFGWIGLLGLAGLAGLMRRDRARSTSYQHQPAASRP
jgi:MYXO-CTERM domain-containing protein